MKRAVQAAALTVLLLALAVLGGYALHQFGIVTLIPGLEGMSPLTSIGLGFLAASLLTAAGASKPALARALALVALTIGLTTLFCQLAFGSDTLSPWISNIVFGVSPLLSGRTATATALSLAALALAALTRRRPSLADAAAATALVISSLAILGYAYGVHDLYAFPLFRTMAAHTAIGLLILSVASIFVRPEAGWASIILAREPGGAATRRQLFFILLPPIAGALLLALTDAHRLGLALAMAFLVAFTVIPLALLILRDGRLLIAADRERMAHAQVLHSQLAAQAEALEFESAQRLLAQAALDRAQRLDAVGQLTGGIAHDFNNLLMALGGNLQLLLKRLPEDHPARRFADNAAAAVDKGSRLTSQLLAFSRTQKLDIRAVELDAVLRQARDLVGNALGPEIKIEMNLAASGCWVETDPDQLEFAILNLSLNARDAMPDGGTLMVKSEMGTDRSEQGEAAAGTRRMASICVIDTGHGMSDEVIRQAVEPFFTTKSRGEGTGLGLAQVYGFVHQCGGEMRIESVEGAGTTVALLLPLAKSAPPLREAVLPRSIAKGLAGAGRSILVIDDDLAVRTTIVDALEGAGFQVMQADGAEKGLRLLDDQTPAAAIIDFIMPGMSGDEVARRIHARLPTLPIIFMSGYFDTLALEGVPHAGILRKPFDIEALSATVNLALH